MIDIKDSWRFFYDEDEFIIAENPRMTDEVCRAVSDFVDDVRRLGTLKRVRLEWDAIKLRYPEGPTGFSINATAVDLVDGKMVEIKSFYEQFETVRIPEADFLHALDEFEVFLRSRG
ncbi:hypothetical protein ACFYTS_03375 [Nocardia sp. NPDC004151]|uniref:hypothetical protein n=1 Tax=Nocardia sp. NPDC004151 TaxID=3364304 RepID=UPI00369293B8